MYILYCFNISQIEPLCIVLAALMLQQYFFLASFCWMLCEGIMIYLLVVRVFGNAAQRWYWLLIVGWGECNTSMVVTFTL